MEGSDVKNVCVYVYLRFPQPVSLLSLIRPLSGLSDNNITIGHFCAETGTHNPRLQGGILHSRTSIFIFNTHLGASISSYKVTENC